MYLHRKNLCALILTLILLPLMLSCRSAVVSSSPEETEPPDETAPAYLWVLEDSDGRSQPPYEDRLSLIDGQGNRIFALPGFSVRHEIFGGTNVLAVSPDGEFVIVSEEGQGRLSRVNIDGQVAWSIDRIVTAAVITTDGTIYADGSSRGLLVVDAADGSIWGEYPFKEGLDLVLDEARGAIWVVGWDIERISLDNMDLQFAIDPIIHGASAAALLPDGSIVVAERSHSEREGSINGLIHVSPDGNVTGIMELDYFPFDVAVDPDSGDIWVSAQTYPGEDPEFGLIRYHPDGTTALTLLPGTKAFGIALDPSDHSIWVNTGAGEIVHFSQDGRELSRLTGYASPSFLALIPSGAPALPASIEVPVVTESPAVPEDSWVPPDVASPGVISPASGAGMLWWLIPVILLLGALLVYFRKPILAALRSGKETGQETGVAGLVESIRDGASRLGNILAGWSKELAKLRWSGLTDWFKRLGKWYWVLLGGIVLLSLILFWPRDRHSAPDMPMPESPAVLTEPPIATEPPSPDFSALRDQIAFSYYDGNYTWIYLMNPDGSDRRPLLGGDGLSYSNPIWSPDGTRLAYLRGHDLMVMSGFHGSETATVQLTSGMMVKNPLWSPDGTKIAFVSDNQLFLVDSRAGSPRLLVQEGAWPAEFTWSPDSAKLAVVYQNPANGWLNLLIVDTSGTVLHTKGGNPTRYHPIWSPLGDSIVYYTVVEGNEQLVQYFIESDSVSVLGGSEGSCGDAHAPSRPALSPDGQSVVYHDCRSAIYVLDMKTLETRSIFFNENTYQGMDALDDVSWSPDGQWILFRVYDEADMGIYRVRPDGSDLLRLSPENTYDSQPVWQPSEKQGAYPLPAELPAPVVTESPTADPSAYTLSLNDITDWQIIAGRWEGGDRTLVQFDPGFEGARFMFVGPTPASPDCFTYRLIAQPLEGREGALVIFPYQGRYVWWNIGGWTNSASRVEYIANSEETYTEDTVIYGSQYMVQVTVRGDTAAGWLSSDSRWQPEDLRWQVVRAPEEVEGLPDDGKRGTGLTGFIGVGTWRTTVQFHNMELIPACDVLAPDRIDINSASLEALATIPAFGMELASAIVYERSQGGPFRSVEDVIARLSLDYKVVEGMSPYMTVR